VSLPPFDEQYAILQWLKSKFSDLDRTLAAAGREISLLREYRTRLIADVVTGKLDVREAALVLPEEVEELEPLDGTEVVAEGEDEPAEDLDTVTDAADA
jgi:type I restriction enzyme S subunit